MPTPAELVPHAGNMCLLNEVVAWTDDDIHCRSASHRQADHPLARAGRLPAVSAIEYAAQAAAAHGALQHAGRPMPPGFIAAAKSITIHVEFLDDCRSTLDIRATRLLEMDHNHIYEFELRGDDQLLVDGRITLMTPNPDHAA